MKKIVCVLPHSHAFFWIQTAISSLVRNHPRADGCEVEIVVVDNSPWSPALLGVTETDLRKYVTIIPNHKGNKFHASALDCVIEKMDFDLMMAMETDVLALKPTWLQWFIDRLKPTDFAAGHFHHEQFINPSCTLYRGDVLRKMDAWCKTNAPQDEVRWGHDFSLSGPLDNNLPLSQNPAEALLNLKGWICGAFAEKRGWPAGTKLKETPSGQLKGPSWYEPGQQLHHWAVEEGYTYTVLPTTTTRVRPVNDELPCQTFYGDGVADPGRQIEIYEMWNYAET